MKGPFNGPIKANYPLDQWWVAATSDEVGREPLGRWLLDKPVVLYRKLDGSVVALDNRCPHRWAPLSKGWLEGDDIVCGYHGFQFCPEGSCVKVPSSEVVPPKARVQAFPVLERGPLIWIWLGDAERMADAPPPPDVPWMTEPGWALSKGHMEVEANYLLLKENVLDLTHFGYVHRNSFKITDWTRAPDVKVDDNHVEFRLDFPPKPLAPLFAAATGFGERPIARVNWGRYVNPALQLAGQDFTDPQPREGERANAAFRVAHATTPVSATRMHYFWFSAWDVPLTAEQLESFRLATVAGFKEDEDMLEAVQEMMRRDPRGADYPEVMVPTDQSAVQARRKIHIRLEQERGHG